MNNNEKLNFNKIFAIITFCLAFISFIYVSLDFINKNREIYKLAILREKHDWLPRSVVLDHTISSEFILKNIGNRTVAIIDAWMAFGFPFDINSMESVKNDKEQLQKLISVINGSLISSRYRDWSPVILNPKDMLVKDIFLVKGKITNKYYELFPKINKTIKIALNEKRLIIGSDLNTGFSDHNLDQIEKNGRFIDIYLFLQVYINDQEKIIKIPFDFIAIYEENQNEKPFTKQLRYSYLGDDSTLVIDLSKAEQFTSFNDLLLRFEE